ncbi:MAG: UDP-N-acetylglucosamine--N-acetylmuramyl-(pentapeptide) pyrophosphoryl-undecaprenol N-acetylglucosamine transferase [Christensenellaceae bacterium]|jgi:UDP-N-acetylglucosamine--N-acetylmuramyl-(pentapeptide) pyrophosphoryl-undecaprenol N-acetylglucosamine transferase|nr:UDP-N-acetylglucosamine--N-acetylmuramyl-(pentapeptide) pyrophosphoryl-undecaprenol N-acetylglucosamine transferase [Christensenellaceae bacterium]
MKVIAITGGGTAGHVTPNLAIVPELRKRFDKIIYIGGTGIESQLAKKCGLEFFSVDTIKFNRQSILANLKMPGVIFSGVKQACKILGSENVSIVFSKGGYVSFPTCVAAFIKKIPVVVHESDASIGMANKITSLFSKATLTSFPEARFGTYVGNPIRDEILCGNPIRARSKYNLSQKPVVLIFGGSTGARDINAVVYEIADRLTKKYSVIHITGNNAPVISIKDYNMLAYADDICDIYAIADVVVMRGGSNSLSECAALGKKMLCIPLPKDRSRGDQIENAASFEKRGCTRVLRQSDLTPERLLAEIDMTFKMPNPIPVRNTAYIAIADEIEKVVNAR